MKSNINETSDNTKSENDVNIFSMTYFNNQELIILKYTFSHIKYFKKSFNKFKLCPIICDFLRSENTVIYF